MCIPSGTSNFSANAATTSRKYIAVSPLTFILSLINWDHCNITQHHVSNSAAPNLFKPDDSSENLAVSLYIINGNKYSLQLQGSVMKDPS